MRRGRQSKTKNITTAKRHMEKRVLRKKCQNFSKNHTQEHKHKIRYLKCTLKSTIR